MLSFLKKKSSQQEGGQQGAEYYNNAFTVNPGWQDHYTQSNYYCIWTVIIDRLRSRPAVEILEVGCGPGQLACAMRDVGVFDYYLGIDFSEVAIKFANEANPDLRFVLDNALTTDIFTTENYDTVVTTEFLEHVEEDMEVIGKIRSGTRVLGTVPNFPYVSHVRHFEDADQVVERYSPYFDDFSVAEIYGVQPNSKFYLIDGVKI